MTKPRRPLTLDHADARLGELTPWLYRVGTPPGPVREALGIAAFYRGEIARLMDELKQTKEGDTAWQRKVGK